MTRSAFVSSVIEGAETLRRAAARAAELQGFRSVRIETHGAKPYSSRIACLSEVDRCDVFILILGSRYAFVSEAGISVTEEEFDRATQRGKPVLAFIQDVEMEPRQQEFRRKVESYEAGFFRTLFSSEEQLKEQVVVALRQLGEQTSAINEAEARTAFDSAVQLLAKVARFPEPALVVGILPQPSPPVDIISFADRLDEKFATMAQAGLCTLKEGYEAIEAADFTGLRSPSILYAIFPNGTELYIFDPTERREGLLMSDHFVPPRKIEDLSVRAIALSEAMTAWVRVGLSGMDDCCVREHPGGSSVQVDFFARETGMASFERLFLPLAPGVVRQWLASAAGRFQRIFK